VVKGFLVLLAALVCALVVSSSAFANSLTCTHGSGPCSTGVGGGGRPSNHGGTLPFTGLSLGGVATVGGLLLVSGLALMQRASRRKS
jgi:hypothetical protein